MFDPEFLELFESTVTIKPVTQDPNSPHAEQSYGAGISTKSHLSAIAVEKAGTGAGDIKTPRGRAYIPGILNINPGDRIVLPNTINDDREILSVDIAYDEDGPHHQVVTFG